jgi:hypothetical protein
MVIPSDEPERGISPAALATTFIPRPFVAQVSAPILFSARDLRLFKAVRASDNDLRCHPERKSCARDLFFLRLCGCPTRRLYVWVCSRLASSVLRLQAFVAQGTRALCGALGHFPLPGFFFLRRASTYLTAQRLLPSTLRFCLPVVLSPRSGAFLAYIPSTALYNAAANCSRHD